MFRAEHRPRRLAEKRICTFLFLCCQLNIKMTSQVERWKITIKILKQDAHGPWNCFFFLFAYSYLKVPQVIDKTLAMQSQMIRLCIPVFSFFRMMMMAQMFTTRVTKGQWSTIISRFTHNFHKLTSGDDIDMKKSHFADELPKSLIFFTINLKNL